MLNEFERTSRREALGMRGKVMFKVEISSLGLRLGDDPFYMQAIIV